MTTLFGVSCLLVGPLHAQASHMVKWRPETFRGLITSLTNSSMELQTNSGTISVPVSHAVTRIVRMVSGTTGDITAGRHVDLHLIRGSHTADVVRISLTPPAHHPKDSVAHSLGARPGDHEPPTMPPSGDVASFSNGTLTLQHSNGTTASYSVAQNAVVTEALSGTFNDLGMGETVQVFMKKPGTPATTVVITNA